MKMFAIIAPFYDILLAGTQKRQAAVMLDRLGPLGGKKVLDAGGGTGYLAEKLARAGAEVFLLDVSLPMLKIARRRLPADRVISGDAACLPFGGGFFDIIVIVDALHHFPRQNEALQEALRVLRPGGRLYILDFTPESGWIRLLERLERLAGEKPVFLTPKELGEKLVDAGFAAKKTERLSRHEYLAVAQKGGETPGEPL